MHIDGGMCEYLSLPETHLFKAEGITLDEAAMAERGLEGVIADCPTARLALIAPDGTVHTGKVLSDQVDVVGPIKAGLVRLLAENGLTADDVKWSIDKAIKGDPSYIVDRVDVHYNVGHTKAAGADTAVIHELPAVVSFPEHAEMRVQSPLEISIQANTLGHSLETMPEGLEGAVSPQAMADLVAFLRSRN